MTWTSENRVWPVLLALASATAGAGDQKGIPDDGEGNFAAGAAHLRDGRTDLAISEFKKAIKKDDKNAYFYKGLGLALAQKNELKDALSALRKALELNPYYVDVRNDLGERPDADGGTRGREEGVHDGLQRPDQLQLGPHGPQPGATRTSRRRTTRRP